MSAPLDEQLRKARPILLRVVRNAGIVGEHLSDEGVAETVRAILDGPRDEPHETDAHDTTAVIGKVDPRLDTRRVDDRGALRIAILRSAYSLCLTTLEDAAPAGRHRSLAVTALEESCLWAVKAVSHAE